MLTRFLCVGHTHREKTQIESGFPEQATINYDHSQLEGLLTHVCSLARHTHAHIQSHTHVASLIFYAKPQEQLKSHKVSIKHAN